MASLTDAVIDTVALVRHLDDSLPKTAESIFRTAENGRGTLYLPEIALGEFTYLALRGRLGLTHPRAAVEEVIDQVRAAGYIQLSALPPAGWSVFLDLNVPELHGRLIASDALARGVPLVSNDRDLAKVSGLRLIWD